MLDYTAIEKANRLNAGAIFDALLLFLAIFGAVLLAFAVFDRKQVKRDRSPHPRKSALWGIVLVLASVIGIKTVAINGHGASLLLIYPIIHAFAVGLFDGLLSHCHSGCRECKRFFKIQLGGSVFFAR